MSTNSALIDPPAARQKAACPECGAAGRACETRFLECLAREFESDYGAVHHLTVAAYLLQHSSRLSREGWLYERGLLREFLVENKTPERIRKQNKSIVDSGKRTFKIKSRDGLPVISGTPWTRTILDVRTENPKVYCEDVAGWAKAVLEEAERLDVPGTSGV